jgi:hypothetical protein
MLWSFIEIRLFVRVELVYAANSVIVYKSERAVMGAAS